MLACVLSSSSQASNKALKLLDFPVNEAVSEPCLAASKPGPIPIKIVNWMPRDQGTLVFPYLSTVCSKLSLQKVITSAG